MPHFLRNPQLEMQVDLPLEGYARPRFDWTGKIVSLRYQGLPIAGQEKDSPQEAPSFGRGFYHEFGLDRAIGYDEVEPGGWFPKLGIGSLQRDEQPYRFHADYPLRPAEFAVEKGPEQLLIRCTAPPVNGYAYRLHKQISLHESGFELGYELENTGEKALHTQEYTHNFLAPGGDPVGPPYRLHFPFALRPDALGEALNPGEGVAFEGKDIRFRQQPEGDFFFSYLAGQAPVEARWTLENLERGIGITERCSLPAAKVNLWGCGHVISPELFVDIQLAPGETQSWSRRYEVFRL